MVQNRSCRTPQDGAEHPQYHPHWVGFDRFMPQNWSKGVCKMVLKIQKSAQKRGLLRVFLRRPQRNSWAFGSGEFFFSAPECDNDLGLASPCMPTCPLEVIFSRIIPIFLFGGGGGGGGGASFRQGLLTGACGFQRRFVRIRLVSHISDEVPESKFARRKCSVVGTFEVI